MTPSGYAGPVCDSIAITTGLGNARARNDEDTKTPTPVSRVRIDPAGALQNERNGESDSSDEIGTERD